MALKVIGAGYGMARGRGYGVPVGAGSARELAMPPERDLFP